MYSTHKWSYSQPSVHHHYCTPFPLVSQPLQIAAPASHAQEAAEASEITQSLRNLVFVNSSIVSVSWSLSRQSHHVHVCTSSLHTASALASLRNVVSCRSCYSPPNITSTAAIQPRWR